MCFCCGYEIPASWAIHKNSWFCCSTTLGATKESCLLMLHLLATFGSVASCDCSQRPVFSWTPSIRMGLHGLVQGQKILIQQVFQKLIQILCFRQCSCDRDASSRGRDGKQEIFLPSTSFLASGCVWDTSFLRPKVGSCPLQGKTPLHGMHHKSKFRKAPSHVFLNHILYQYQKQWRISTSDHWSELLMKSFAKLAILRTLPSIASPFSKPQTSAAASLMFEIHQRVIERQRNGQWPKVF